MGTSLCYQLSPTMVATLALISLCAVGLSSAVSRPVNQQVIVSDVVSALQPSIARAVAQALQGVGSRGGSTFSSTSSTGFASGSRFTGTGLSGSTGSISGSVGVSGGAGAAVAEVTARPEYNFQYQVSDDIDQTYITQNEARDGDDVTGTYSNVDLITVNYQAGANGYMQTLEKQVGAVEMRARPVKVQSAQAVQSVQSGSQASRASASTGRFQSGSSNSFRSSSASSAASGAVGVDQSALIRQILAVLQPQISVAVNSAVSNL